MKDHAEEFFALLTHEAGKTLSDCIGELREAVDFLRYYARQAEAVDSNSHGIFTCISPWNFPLAIFTGQIAAALAMGNGVLAKPAEATSLIAVQATALLHQAGVPKTCLQLLPGHGPIVGPVVCGAPNVSGVCFTGSTKPLRRQSIANYGEKFGTTCALDCRNWRVERNDCRQYGAS